MTPPTMVTVTGNRTTVYGRARQETEVELTPRVQALIDAGILSVVSGGASSLRTAPGATIVPDPLPPRADLVHAAERRGIEVPVSWNRRRIADEIALYDSAEENNIALEAQQ